MLLGAVKYSDIDSRGFVSSLPSVTEVLPGSILAVDGTGVDSDELSGIAKMPCKGLTLAPIII